MSNLTDRRLTIGAGIALAVIVLSMGLTAVFAQTEVPDGVQVFTIDSGQTCVLWPDGSGDCYCPCKTGLCSVTTYGADTSRTPEPTNRPGKTPTPRVDTVPSSTPEIEPTIAPEPTDAPEPSNPKCNRGTGNGDEDCDPGNSGGNPGNAGEGNDG